MENPKFLDLDRTVPAHVSAPAATNIHHLQGEEQEQQDNLGRLFNALSQVRDRTVLVVLDP